MPNLKSRKISAFLLLVNLMAIGMTMISNSRASVPLYDREENVVWEKYTAKGQEFSVLMPELPGVTESAQCFDVGCHSKRVDITYAAYSDGVVYYVTSYQNPNGRQSLEDIIAESMSYCEMNACDTVKNDVKLDRFAGKKFISVSKSHGFDILSVFYMTDKHVYEVTAVGGNRNDPAIQAFFKSFTLGGNKGNEIGNGGRTGLVSTTLTEPQITTSTSSTVNTQISGVRGGGGGDTVYKSIDVTRTAIIILKPSPEYTEEARRNQLSGTVTLQMVLTSSGKVTSIRTISGLKHGLTEKAIGAARKIYFLPAVKDGRRVSQYIRVEYNFNIY